MKKPHQNRRTLSRTVVALGASAALLLGGVASAPLAAAATVDVEVSNDENLPAEPFVFLKNGDQLIQLKNDNGEYRPDIFGAAPTQGVEYEIYVVGDASGPTEDDRPNGTFTPPAQTWSIGIEFVDGPVTPPDTEDPEDPEDPDRPGIPQLPAIPGSMNVYLVDTAEDGSVYNGERQQDNRNAFSFEDVPAGTYDLRVGTSPTSAFLIDDDYTVDEDGDHVWDVPATFDLNSYPLIGVEVEDEDVAADIPADQNVYLINADGTYEAERLTGAGEGFFQFREVPAGTYQLVVGPSVQDSVVVNDEYVVSDYYELRGSFALRFPADLDLDEQPDYRPGSQPGNGGNTAEGSSGSSFENGLSSLFSFGSSR